MNPSVVIYFLEEVNRLLDQSTEVSPELITLIGAVPSPTGRTFPCKPSNPAFSGGELLVHSDRSHVVAVRLRLVEKMGAAPFTARFGQGDEVATNSLSSSRLAWVIGRSPGSHNQCVVDIGRDDGLVHTVVVTCERIE